MQHVTVRLLLRALRVFSLVVLAVLGTVAFMRLAPGYFSDTREMDAQHSAIVRADVESRQTQESTFAGSIRSLAPDWKTGLLGRSRQYDVPVTQLLRERVATSGKLLLIGVLAGWLLALVLAVLLSAQRSALGHVAISCATAIMLALPVGVLAILCLLTDFGGPVFVLAMLIAVRDFKLLYRLIRQAWRAPRVLYARAQGFSFLRILRLHVLRNLGGELLSLGMVSFVVALSAMVPVEVIFDVPGLGQLAWAAAMNRDLPVLGAVTALLAGCVGTASMFVESQTNTEVLQCA